MSPAHRFRVGGLYTALENLSRTPSSVVAGTYIYVYIYICMRVSQYLYTCVHVYKDMCACATFLSIFECLFAYHVFIHMLVFFSWTLYISNICNIGSDYMFKIIIVNISSFPIHLWHKRLKPIKNSYKMSQNAICQ